MIPSSLPAMPFATKAADLNAPANLMPPMPMSGSAPQPPAGGAVAPTAQASPQAAAMPPQGGMPQLPAPGAPPKPFWSVRQQADGSSIDFITLPDGSERVLAVHEPPKLPKAFQPAQPAAQ